MMRVSLFLLMGAVAMLAAAASPVADGQEKKEDAPRAPYDQFVKWESLDKDGKVTHTADRVPAKQQATKAPTWIVDLTAIKAEVPKAARVTDKDGKVTRFKEIRVAAPARLLCIVDESGAKAP